MTAPRVSIEMPPGQRSCGGIAGNIWVVAKADEGHEPFAMDLRTLKEQLPSAEAVASCMESIRHHMALAEDGRLTGDLVVPMHIAPDVLEIRLPDWWFSGGKMHLRLYFSEPRALSGHLVALRLLAKRPGRLGVGDQDRHAADASDLLLAFQNRGFR